MSSGDALDTELESFRNQWLSDIKTQRVPPQSSDAAASSSSASHRRRQSHSKRHDAARQSFSSSSGRPGPPPKTNGPPSPTAARRAVILDEGSDYLEGRVFDELAPPLTTSSDARTLAISIDATAKPQKKKLVSALDHYEEAMEKEAQGNMGDSLQLYRKAYKMDHGVERRYREKHFPAGQSKAPAPQAAGASTATATAPASVPQYSVMLFKVTRYSGLTVGSANFFEGYYVNSLRLSVAATKVLQPLVHVPAAFSPCRAEIGPPYALQRWERDEEKNLSATTLKNGERKKGVSPDLP
ncbi:hypothetical protein NLG97_g8562 [Lecanicillium saksenae]|uniref:Uncharacterized protein n=1 Tax=Lecanicillium saksenae TaxID=468837 RepID=A0ACC1QJ52_9HYPO|nr:hypothetical protein NLG97_g8562 [Lecanicillium saksenae]